MLIEPSAGQKRFLSFYFSSQNQEVENIQNTFSGFSSVASWSEMKIVVLAKPQTLSSFNRNTRRHKWHDTKSHSRLNKCRFCSRGENLFTYLVPHSHIVSELNEIYPDNFIRFEVLPQSGTFIKTAGLEQRARKPYCWLLLPLYRAIRFFFFLKK